MRDTYANALLQTETAARDLERAEAESQKALEVYLQIKSEVDHSLTRRKSEREAVEHLEQERSDADRRLQEARAAHKRAADGMQGISTQIHSFALENLLAPSAEKFPVQFAAASGVLSALTAGLLAFAGAMARVTALTLPLKFLIALGFVGILFGLAFHLPPLVVHFRDWRVSESGNFDPNQDVADVVHSKKVQAFQFVVFGFQAIVWITLASGMLALVLGA